VVGRHLSHYEVLEEISRGGMGIVYRARDTKLNREVALKVLPPELISDAGHKRRFLQEARAAAGLKHPNIAVVYEIDEDEGGTFIAMELIDGRALEDVIAERRLPLNQCLELAIGITDALVCAHERGIARTSAGAGRGPPLRHLLARNHPLRDSSGPTPIRRRDRRGRSCRRS